ncbi:hypothetical protein DVH24_012167 [Malus domestica]|uniref:Uncharacterized protein n=1 Tax=Malus domestica TaxID=3750 RepID=A0A498HUC7_MALDO|nr:hypothetical protein DVH24_012167 [Malus domestica]
MTFYLSNIHFFGQVFIYKPPHNNYSSKGMRPQVVSIGPLHHGKEHLKAIEEHKIMYLRDFLSRTEASFYDYI